ncbi:secreted protein, putative [Ixodes scapularis]|uniref:Secreted protein, putative n=1 Tax=Ixodes scapularis TaxID=6945 RepID=B7PQV9_IXOSC|nr:secreted protein, putative [Ixodes scapularis]|eukprot:XP_002436151.1 secreted protein, putative [Ixodes scapularis]
MSFTSPSAKFTNNVSFFYLLRNSVLSNSPLNCKEVDCDEVVCSSAACTCGSHKSECGCCDICNKCPGETCITIHDDLCQEGYECKLKDPAGNIFGGDPGSCVPKTETPHDPAQNHT